MEITNIDGLLSGHTPYDPDMGFECLPESFVFHALDTKLLTGLLYDPIDCRIMYMADFGKKMVLHLEIQSSEQPGQHLTLSGKISCRLHLMYHPFLLNLIGIYIFEFRFFNHMRKLEYGSQADPAQYSGH